MRNRLVCELPIDHVVLGCQSFPGLSANRNLSSSLRVDSIFVAIRIHLYIGDKNIKSKGENVRIGKQLGISELEWENGMANFVIFE